VYKSPMKRFLILLSLTACALGPGPQQTYLAEWDKWMVNCEADGGTPTQWPGAGRWTCEPCHPDGTGGCRHAP
jgi:hypothetical protein